MRLLSTQCNKQSAAYCLWVKTCKRYFKAALSIQDEYSESIYDVCHVYLSALYYVSRTNPDRTIRHCKEVMNRTSFSNNPRKPYTVNYSSLLFVDTIAHVCGFCNLFDHFVHKQSTLSARGFTLSTIVLCLIFLTGTHNENSSSKLNLPTPLDACLRAVSAHEYRQTKNQISGRCLPSTPKHFGNNGEIILTVTLGDPLEETLMKISVEMLTKYYESPCITMTQAGFPHGCKLVSHFKALYYYRTGEYTKLLDTCNVIISREIFLFAAEERKHPPFLSGHDVRDVLCISVVFTFQMFFRNDVICLNGLIALTDRSLFSEKHRYEADGNFIEILRILENSSYSSCEYLVKFFQGKLRGFQTLSNWPKISHLFLVYYLRIQSLIQLNYPKSDILSALNDLKHASAGYVFEDILLLFVGLTLKRVH